MSEFLDITSPASVANYLGTSYRNLASVIYPRNGDKAKYRRFLIEKKSSGYRSISSPVQELLLIQRKLKLAIDDIYLAPRCVHGFVRGRSILTNALPHVGASHVVSLDLTDFFGSIHFGRVRELFKEKPFSFHHNTATVLAQICTFENQLPQGAPTSPVIANMVCIGMDNTISEYASSIGYRYTRYADDLSFSPEEVRFSFPYELLSPTVSKEKYQASTTLRKMIHRCGFRIHPDKTRICYSLNRMSVTGLTTNEFPNVRRSFIRETQSMLYAWRKWGYAQAQEHHFIRRKKGARRSRSFRNITAGRIAYVKMVRGEKDPIYLKLSAQFKKLDKEITQLKSEY